MDQTIKENEKERQIVRIDDGVQFVIEKYEDNNVLHLLLHARAAIKMDIKFLCWSSESVKMKLNINYFLSYESEVGNIINDSDILASAAISNGHNVDFTVIDISSSHGLYVIKDAFLCASLNTEIVSSKFPIKSFNVFSSFFNPYLMGVKAYLIQHIDVAHLSSQQNQSNISTVSSSSNKSTLFLQYGSKIMTHCLSAGECTHLSYSCLVAVDTTCQIIETQVSYNSTPTVLMLKIQGPGNVYFSAAGKRWMSSMASGGVLTAGGGAAAGGLNPAVGILGHRQPNFAIRFLLIAYLVVSLILLLQSKQMEEFVNLLVNQLPPPRNE